LLVPLSIATTTDGSRQLSQEKMKDITKQRYVELMNIFFINIVKEKESKGQVYQLCFFLKEDPTF